MATFKRVGTIDTFREKFIDGMTARGYDAISPSAASSQIEGFGEYGFPESHAASFANLVYASAWIKCHYPDVFAAALLNSQPMGFYAPARSCATRRSTASRCGRSTSISPTGIARWNPARRRASGCIRATPT